MLNPIDISLTGLRAFGRKLGVTAHNVANVNTDGFRPGRTQLVEASRGGVQARVENPPAQPTILDPTLEEQPPRLSAVDLGQESVQMIVAKRGYQANLKALHAADAAEQSVLDILS